MNNPGMLTELLGETRSTVPELLGADLRSSLRQRGFRVSEGPGSDAPKLQVEIRRWDLYYADYSRITVDLVATLIEPGSGRTLWTAQRTNWKVATPNAQSSIDASMLASQAIAEALLDGWQSSAAGTGGGQPN